MKHTLILDDNDLDVLCSVVAFSVLTGKPALSDGGWLRLDKIFYKLKGGEK